MSELRPGSRRPSVRAALRGPVRNGVRQAQARMPALARGRVAGPPDFIGVGAQRAGSSWWHRLLEEHPDVSPLGLGAKELHFFDDFWRGGFDDQAQRAYSQLFLRPQGNLCGEWTPRYMYDPWVPALLRRAAPDARILVLLRDPVERFRSGVRHAATFIGPVDADVVNSAIARGYYGAQVSRLLEHFPREQVQVLQFEQCRANPVAMLERTARFLGVDPAKQPVSAHVSTPRNAVSGDPVGLDPELIAGLPKLYADDVRLLRDLVGADIDLKLWANFAELADR